jgi:hypothetical protein
MQITASSAAVHSLGAVVQQVKFAPSNGPVAYVAPGATVTGTANYQVWRSDGSGYCPGCVIEWALGVDSVGQIGCFVYGGGTFPGQTGTQSFSFTAPTTPGTYVMRQALALEYTCAQAGYPGGEDVGLVVVQ